MNTNTTTHHRTVSGVELEAVRATMPRPHWLIRVVSTGYTHEHGVFPGKTEAAVWDSVERTARALGADRWQRETLSLR